MAARKHKQLAPTKRAVPAYMMSYGDMMTLLLTFFVLLVSMAEEQLAGMVAAGTGSFVRALDSMGLPGILSGGRRPIRKGVLPPNFLFPERAIEVAPDGKIPNPHLITPPNDRIRDATIDYLRQNKSVALPTEVGFRPHSAELTPASRKQLDSIGELAQQSLSYVAVEAHVAGPGAGWALSALRASAVARYLHDRSGIAYSRIALAGYGRFRPVTEEARTAERVNILLSPKPLD